MDKRTHLFLVAIDEDPLPGGMDAEHIETDVKFMITHAFVRSYNPQVHHLCATTRESNFLDDTALPLNVLIVRPEGTIYNDGVNIQYFPEHARGQEETEA